MHALILILFFPTGEKNPVYNKIAEIIDALKRSMVPIKENWAGSGFSDKRRVRSVIKGIPQEMNKIVQESEKSQQDFEENISIFEVKCPECASIVSVKVPKKIKGLLAIPVQNIPCWA